ncbi:hypothetical protein OQA88_4423 [Cercophora sp. LCS_1]
MDIRSGAEAGPSDSRRSRRSPRKTDRQRVRTGCFTCRGRRVKCGEEKPTCKRCQTGNRECVYGNGERAPKRGPPKAWPELPALEPRPEVGPFLAAQFAGPASASSSEPIRLESPPSPRPSTTSEGVYEHGLSPTFSAELLPDVEAVEVPPSNFHYQIGGFEEFYPSNSAWMSTLTNDGEPPALLPGLSDVERQALEYYDTNANFGFASKPAGFSTYKILRQVAEQSTVGLHLLLAASFAELACDPDTRNLGLNAENHYKVGVDNLEPLLSSPTSDAMVVMACFWFMYLYQKRWRTAETWCWATLSSFMANFFERTSLHLLLSSEPNMDAGQPILGSPLRRAVMARLTVWLYGIDAQGCSHGEGGSLAQLIQRSISTAGLLRIFDTSREEFPLRWGDGYPADMVVDDLTNAPALELLHHTWAILQEINDEASNFRCPIKPERANRILLELDTMRRRYPISLVFRLTESHELERGRLLGNCDWAVGNFYAARIYLFRCSLSKKDHDLDSGAGSTIAQTVTDLIGLLQRTLRSGDNYQVDRMQFALFWAGVESPVRGATGKWIRSKLWRRGLAQPLQTIMLEQLELGKRATIERIRQVCIEVRGDDAT